MKKNHIVLTYKAEKLHKRKEQVSVAGVDDQTGVLIFVLLHKMTSQQPGYSQVILPLSPVMSSCVPGDAWGMSLCYLLLQNPGEPVVFKLKSPRGDCSKDDTLLTTVSLICRLRMP